MNEAEPIGRVDLVLFALAALGLVAISTWMAWRLDYAPDETSHGTVVAVLAEEGRPLTWEDTRAGADRGHAYHLYSPVAYLPYVPAQWAANAIGPVEASARPEFFVVRLGASSVALAQLAATWALARRLRPSGSARQALALAVAVNLVPQLRYMHAYVTTDGATVLAATIAAATAARVLQRRQVRAVDGVLVGLAVASCAHVRYNALIVAGLAVAALAWRAVKSTGEWRPRLRPLLMAAAVALVLAAPFHLWVYQEQANGHMTASISHEQLRESTFLGSFSPDVSTSELVRIRWDTVDEVGQGVWMRFQRYGVVPIWQWRAIAALTVAGMVAALASRHLPATTKALTVGFFLSFLATWVAMSAQWPFTSHGRFLLPAGLPLITAALTGFTANLAARWPAAAYVVPGVTALGLGHLCWVGLESLIA